MKPMPRYIANPSKAVEVILWLSGRERAADVYRIVKAAYFADRYHVEKYGRPICGDSYQAAPFGPLPQVLYGLLRRDPIEMIALGGNGDLPFRVDERHRVIPERDANEARLSDSDREALAHGAAHVRGRSFDDILEETHQDPAYLRASGQQMDYRDFIADADPHRDEKRRHIEEMAAGTVF